MKQPCLDCGVLTEGRRCARCNDRLKKLPPAPPTEHGRAARARRGYSRRAWTDLSRKARTLQPFCSDCGSTRDLETDHSPVAWARLERGLSVRLQDVDVVCARCNRERGPARGPQCRPLTEKEKKEMSALESIAPRNLS